MNKIAEGYRKKFARQKQSEIGETNCDNCGKLVRIADFVSAEALEVFCCGSGNDKGFCQSCQNELRRV